MESSIMNEEFKDLTVEELTRGYVIEDGVYRCIFCGETFEDGLIYTSRGRSVTAGKAMAEHIADRHGSSFSCLVAMDKQVNGLSETQKNLLLCMYDDMDNKEIGEDLGISPATVRTHKFNLQKMKREAKIMLALMEQLENEELVEERRRMAAPDSAAAGNPAAGVLTGMPEVTDSFSGNMLHPFFTRFDKR